MNERFDVSIIVSTYNRCQLLPAALQSLLSQEAGEVSYEVVLVDNNSTDGTREVVESYIARGHANLRYIFEGKQGLSHGWNAGINDARGEIIAFSDDDVVVARDWVASIKRAFDEHPEVDFVGGKVLPIWKSEPPAWLTTDHWSPLAILDHGDEPFYVNLNKPYPLLNKSFRRAVFERVGVFRPEMGRVKDGIGSTEDHDLQLRIWRAGGQGLYVPYIIMEAEVPEDRLTKAYHRRWHKGHGKYCSMMNLRDITDHEGRINEEYTSSSTLFGAPGFLYRELLADCLRCIGATLRGREGKSFQYENKVRFLIGYLGKRYNQHAATRKHSAAAEIGSYVRSLISKGKTSASAIGQISLAAGLFDSIIHLITG
jgi:glycosyltransferase involved in cell wall biosynthesis